MYAIRRAVFSSAVFYRSCNSSGVNSHNTYQHLRRWYILFNRPVLIFLTCVTGYIGVFFKNYQLKLIDREKGGEQANVNISMASLAFSCTYSRRKHNISRIRGLHRLHPRQCGTPCRTSCSAILDYLS